VKVVIRWRKNSGDERCHFSHLGLPKSWPLDDGRVNSPVKGSVHVSRRNSSNATHLRRTCVRVIRGVSCELCDGSQNQHPSCDLFVIRFRYTPDSQWFVRSCATALASLFGSLSKALFLGGGGVIVCLPVSRSSQLLTKLQCYKRVSHEVRHCHDRVTHEVT
jgi:hypothetical protein